MMQCHLIGGAKMHHGNSATAALITSIAVGAASVTSIAPAWAQRGDEYVVTRSSINALSWPAALPERETNGSFEVRTNVASKAKLVEVQIVTAGIRPYSVPTWAVDDGKVKNTSDMNVTFSFTGTFTADPYTGAAEVKPLSTKFEVTDILLRAGESHDIRGSSDSALKTLADLAPRQGCFIAEISLTIAAKFVDSLGVDRKIYQTKSSREMLGGCPPLPPPPPPPPPPPYLVLDIAMSASRDAGPTRWSVRPKPILLDYMSDLFIVALEADGSYANGFAGDFQVRMIMSDGRVFTTAPLRLIKYTGSRYGGRNLPRIEGLAEVESLSMSIR